jgi:hypothetical protein
MLLFHLNKIIIKALNRLEAIFDYQISETDFVTNIQVRKINKISDAIMLIKYFKAFI